MIEQELLTQVKLLTNWTVFLNTAIENQITPYVVIRKTSAPRSYTNDGRDGMVQSIFQIDLFANNYKTIKEEAYKLYALADHTSSTIAYIVLSNEYDLYENDTGLHHVVLEFYVNNYE